MEDAEEPAAGDVHVLLPDPPVHARVVPGRALSSSVVEELAIAGSPEPWAALGFSVDGSDACAVGAVRLRFGGPGEGIVGWRVRGLAEGSLDGLATWSGGSGREVGGAGSHANGAVGVDHVVAATPDFERTLTALRSAGMVPRRIREAGDRGARQAFYVVGPALLEVVGPAQPEGEGPARFWGVTFVTRDLDATAALLGSQLGEPRDAVQPGRRIATVRRSAGLGVPVAFMTPRGA